MQTRLFGVALIGGGVLTGVANAVFSPQLAVDGSFAELAISQAFLIRLSLAAAGLILVLLGMIGLYMRHAGKIGWFSAFAFVLAFCGTAAIMAHEWAQVFYIRHFAVNVPAALNAADEAPSPNLLEAEAIIAASSFSLGWLLWCITMWRARAVSRLGAALVSAGLLGAPLLGAAANALNFSVVYAMAAGSVLFSLGWIVLGRALMKPAL